MSGPWNVMFDTLRDQSRRQVVVSLLDAESRTVDEILQTAGRRDRRDRRALRIAFCHIHLPKLHETGYVDWRKGADEVHRGPRFDELEPVLEVLHRNREQLPEGWL